MPRNTTAPQAAPPRLDGTEPCLRPDVDWRMFFPHEADQVAVANACALCRVCPRIAACLAWALEADEDGIWAATTTARRAELRDQYGITTSMKGFQP